MTDPADIVLAAVGVVGLLGSAAVALLAVGGHRQTLRNLKDEVFDLKKRVDKAEDAAAAVASLAASVDAMGEKFANELGHLVEKVGLEMGFMRTQFDDLKQEVRRRRGLAPRRSPAKP
jgi:hypothetical protein